MFYSCYETYRLQGAYPFGEFNLFPQLLWLLHARKTRISIEK